MIIKSFSLSLPRRVQRGVQRGQRGHFFNLDNDSKSKEATPNTPTQTHREKLKGGQ